MVEFVEKVNVLLSPDKSWYATYRFKGFTDFTEVDGFIEELRENVEQELSDTMSAKAKGDERRLTVTFKGMDTASEAEDLMEDLRKLAKKHRGKGQKALDE